MKNYQATTVDQFPTWRARKSTMEINVWYSRPFYGNLFASPDPEEEVENLPPIQPDVNPLERENPDIDTYEENKPTETPEVENDDEESVDIEQRKRQQDLGIVDRHSGNDDDTNITR
ncbi:hypothetical protein [Sphingobacterium suaedae]|uniref:Uncharacterized protein n=1 Tax=Sphingobacterium suaedae TaxID=1686402 RepID=A0ABW5KCZ7_9SPHI